MLSATVALKRRVTRVFVVLVLAVFALGAFGEVRPALRRMWREPMDSPVRVDCEVEDLGYGIKVSYEVTNRTRGTILVFDQMAQEGTLSAAYPYGIPDNGWAYVEFERDGWSLFGWTYKAILSRRVRDQGMDMHYREPLPYARRLAAGAKLKGSFLVATPLKEELARTWGYGPRQKDRPFSTTLDVREFELWIGWSEDLPLETMRESQVLDPFSYGNETLWFFYFGWYLNLDAAQRTAMSDAKGVHWRALLY